MKGKEESEKLGLKLNIQKTKIMASGPITSGNRWGNNGNSERIQFFRLQVTADGDCSHEIKRHLLLGRKVMTKPYSLLKSRDIADKSLASQSCCFSSSHVCGFYLFSLPVRLPSEIRKLPPDPPVRGFPVVWKLPLLRLPSRDGSPSLTLFPLFLSFIFYPTSF